jgi:hypothetical protein
MTRAVASTDIKLGFDERFCAQSISYITHSASRQRDEPLRGGLGAGFRRGWPIQSDVANLFTLSD